MFLGYHQKLYWCLRGNVMQSKTLVILINDFGWDFLANDLPEDRVAARLGDLSLGNLICHLCLSPEQPAGEKVGRRWNKFKTNFSLNISKKQIYKTFWTFF